MLNVRYGIPGEARPLMFNEELEAFFFEVAERGVRTDLSAREKPRTIYFVDWKAEEVYLVENAKTIKEVSQEMVTGGGLGGLKLKQLKTDPEGEKIIDKVMEEDEEVMPLLVARLGYTPTPTEDLVDKYLDETEEILGGELREVEKPDAELVKESGEAYDDIMRMLEEDMDDEESLLEAEELLGGMKQLTPEEMKPLRDLLALLKQTDPAKFDELKPAFLEHLVALEREVQNDGKELGELLMKAKQNKRNRS
ncbi:hypothetical protein EST38_g8805 [Candolleomyces aberdarensis]|uniref:Uncharacterized protein n=1 Tax=Candolleomyces aberdarensis TaxID=2316362 RepID=A0A4Q2DCD9_9AGAR|nr:hypothetical protein EST38_g8805 [Candolleomyces aberdarensis]